VMLAVAAAWLAGLAATADAAAKSCTRDLSPKEFSGGEPFEMTCEAVAVKLLPIESEMYYHRWSGQITVRAISGDEEAKINLAAFDAAGDLVGVASVFARDVKIKSKVFSFRMEGMFVSTANAAKVILSVNIADRRSP
jgi:hypothetical protein